jgi:hypothetical protein
MNIETLIEYLKITIIGLEQDLEGIAEEMDMLDPESKDCKDLDIEYNFISGQATGMRHILEVAQKG